MPAPKRATQRAGQHRTPSGDETLYIHSDHLGSPDTLTSGTGATFTQAFDAFGAPDPDNAELTRNGFTGHEHDRDLGLIDMKGRIYDPLAAQFLSADPVMQAPHWSQGMNRYAYVFNDPVNATDPSGFAAAGLDGYAVPAHLAGTTAALYGSSTAGLGAAAGIGGLSGATSLALGVPGMFTGTPGYSGTVTDAASVAPTAGSATQPGIADAVGGNRPFQIPVPSGPDLRLAQSMHSPSTGADVPGNVPDTRPDVPPQLGPSDAVVVAVPRALVAIAEAAEAWLVRAGAALRAIGPALSVPEAVLVSPIIVPGDSSVVHAEGYSDKPGKIAEEASRTLGKRVTPKDVEKAIHQVKKGLGRGGPVRNPDVEVHPRTGDVRPKTPDGLGDSIGNIFDFL